MISTTPFSSPGVAQEQRDNAGRSGVRAVFIASKRDPDVMALRKVANRWAEISGEHLTRSRIQQIIEKAIQKLRNGLEDDPLVREWLCEHGLGETQ